MCILNVFIELLGINLKLKSSMGFNSKQLFRIILLVLMIFINYLTLAQDNCNNITSEMGYTVQSVKINARWVSKELQNRIEQIVGIGRPFDPDKVNAAEITIREEIAKNEKQMEFWLLEGSTSVLVINSKSCDVSTDINHKEVAVEISPYYIRVD